MTARSTRRRLDSRLVVGLIMFGFMIGVAVFAPLIARNDPLAIDFHTQFLAPPPTTGSAPASWASTSSHGWSTPPGMT